MIRFLRRLLYGDGRRTYIGCFTNAEINDLPEDELSIEELEERAA